MSKLSTTALLAVMIIAAVPLATAPEAKAQGFSLAPTAKEKPRQYKRPDKEYSYVFLQAPVSLPGVPQPPAKFVLGTYVPGSRSGCTYIMQYNFSDSKEYCRDWYMAALTAGGWTLDREQAAEQLSGRDRAGNVCHMAFLDSSTVQGKTDVMITYRQIRQ